MKANQRKNFIILLVVFLIVKFIVNGIQGDWSIIKLFKEEWASLLGMILSYSLIVYLNSKRRKNNNNV